LAEGRGNWAKLQRLSGWQWRVMLATPFVLLITRMRLRREGYVETLERTRPAGAREESPKRQLALARETAYAQAVAVKYGPWKPLCLLRSLTLAWFLGRKGIPFDVRIGLPEGRSFINAEGELDFSAHAWVECQGRVLNDKENIAEEFNAFSGLGPHEK
jgi:hypothetical protein